MKKITSISELKKGDKIAHVFGNGNYEIIEFLCIHPYNKEYSLFLNQNKDGMPKFYNNRLKGEDWYLYTSDNFNDLIDLRIDKLGKMINKFNEIKR